MWWVYAALADMTGVVSSNRSTVTELVMVKPQPIVSDEC
jgi:hypothetical protein